MQTLPAQELKRRGLAALDKLLPAGPVHVIRNNRPAAVVLSPEEYDRLTARPAKPGSLWDFIEAAGTTAHATRTRDEIDADLRAERDSWERR
jgi:PHD/YefM family antitoxin component YafN of YafNO toxin-antitoxin module